MCSIIGSRNYQYKSKKATEATFTIIETFAKVSRSVKKVKK